ncbi:NAD(P)/FAD-dependent oxidoreductase [Paenarthrobacter aurescens]|uniref:Putative oxidoreductase CzcO n=1 Tax=Paenarthrobacter aurescens TaxID=43663 RepID=A0A4Y3N7U5_PAEAU|nr:NAD(P)-binding domain-containing protein [Paenarthrobacter aurescens]MDO6144281.1 NAD(P)/FAD-dependent oxidoreductase [Paenarthrobacter aurescens]MDO6148128.1 NAD(P)/FAD-dependent oxidoreductase [Paenarthrobacter aurescens]MDO6159372.1 NAD(P)/FAD-dependent oxidoreductase [Paenarthrobacter aurescens]MDO6163355.1 NAD(P)/FAD-dependent oxidoreductase [Paenarthrobacter aurescens]GEB17840.1 putative oxidoreductase CzcO [Paenarthrobacter aurescens]
MNAKQESMVDTLIVGGGQAGLALGYFLAKEGRDFLILDQYGRPGEAWRQRWDSLRLFTPAKYDGLPGAPFPGDRLAFPSKDQMADYLEDYVRRFDLPFVSDVRVDGINRHGAGFTVTAGDRSWRSKNVVIAAGGHHLPKRPHFAGDLDPEIRQLHSADYRNPGQLKDGPVLVVGLGNSGAEIALEVGKSHATELAGRPSGEMPMRHGRTAARFALPVVRFLGLHVLNMNTPVGRKAAPAFKSMAAPLIRTKTKDLVAAGVHLVPRLAGVSQGRPVLEDGTRVEALNVIWCTGYHEDYSWVNLPVFDSFGEPQQRRGVAGDVPGVYFIGQEFLFAAASATLPGVSRDARYLARRLAEQGSGLAGEPAVQPNAAGQAA